MVTRKKSAPKQKLDAVLVPEVDASLPARPKALVFISHDSRDADIAEAFANLLSDISGGTLKSFRSSDKKGNTGIEFGAEWYTSIMSQLGDATDVVALLTARSIDRPWILYEAGVAKGKLETTVLGLALGVPLERVSTGPFGQFQNCGDDEDSLTRLVMQLLQRNPDASPREEAVRIQVKLFIEALSKILEKKPKKAGSDHGDEDQNIAKLFEEVKAMVRELPERVDERVRTTSRRALGKGIRRFHPKMVEEILFRARSSSGRHSNASALLFVLSLVKDEAIWIYEPGMAIYRAMLTGDLAAVVTAHKQFTFSMEFSLESSIFREFVRFGDEDQYMYMRHIPEIIDRFVREYIASAPRRKRITKVPDLLTNDDGTS
jgi:hypothetical protein